MNDTANRTTPDPVRAVELELGGGPLDRAIRLSTLLIVLTVVAVVAWTLIARVDELARARGEVKPTGDVQVIESRDGGRIEELMVREGDHVERGEVLARFERTASESDLRAAQAKKAALEMEVERFTAFVEDREPDFSRYESEFPFLVSREMGAFEAQRRLLRAEQLQAEEKLIQKRAELAALKTEIPAIEKEKKATEESLKIYQTLSERQLTSKVQYADAIQKDASIDRELAAAQGRLTVLEAEIEELTDALEEVKTRFYADALEKRVGTASELRQVQEELAALEERVSETVVTSPVSGTVQSVPKTRVGEVIEPGGKVAEIVPGDAGLQLVARLTPRDVGFVREGQPAKVKIDAYDYSRYGALNGTVERISPTTFVDERGVAYYEVTVDLEKIYFRDDPQQFGLVSGMTGEADIKTGEKTVFQYMWKPIYTNLDLAFTER
jgi:HlyD family secretion protein/adhesin transport system membrane fusion protein